MVVIARVEEMMTIDLAITIEMTIDLVTMTGVDGEVIVTTGVMIEVEIEMSLATNAPGQSRALPLVPLLEIASVIEMLRILGKEESKKMIRGHRRSI